MTFAPTATVVARGRWYGLKLWRRIGQLQATRPYRAVPLGAWLAASAVALAGAQLLVNKTPDLGVWSWMGVGNPEIHVFSLTGVLVAFAIVVSVRWLSQARTRVVVDDFIDFTTNDGTAVSGLATLLATELSRLRLLYSSINETLAVPVAVGVHSALAPGRDAEAGAFLTVRADDLSDMLQGAVASEAKVQVGPVGIPIGDIAAIFGRLLRGPRVVGSVHRTESGGGPTLTAQIVGARQRNTWRVDRSHLSAPTPEDDKAFLDQMVRELAIEMFTDLTMQGAVRWRAIRIFTEYLRDYRRSMRTPKTRSRFLKDAEEKLLEAIAEDEQFDFAYYNLGVIYSQLALTELNTARHWDVKPALTTNPEALHDSRMQAATVAFTRAIERNRDRWEAYYALAVHQMTSVKRGYENGGTTLKDGDKAALREVVRLCDRVVETQPDNAEAHDLRGMAIWYLVKTGNSTDIDGSIASHRRAVKLAWSNLCREERLARKCPPTSETALPKREENATAALHNLAVAYGLKAQLHRAGRVLNYRRADILFRLAIKLAPPGSAARLHSQRARLLRRRANAESSSSRSRRRKLSQACDAYREAARREPDHPLYLAQLARAHAETATNLNDAEPCIELACTSALESLASVWRRALAATASQADQRLTKWTFNALAEAYDALAGSEGEDADRKRMRARARRLRQMDRLGGKLEPRVLATAKGRAKARRMFRAAKGVKHPGRSWASSRIWETEQIGVALARAYTAAGGDDSYGAAVKVLDGLMKVAGKRRPGAVQAHELEIRKANGLRRKGEAAKALEWAGRGLMRDPLSQRGRAELAEIHMALWQYDEALKAWEHTQWLKPNDPFVHFKLGLCHWWHAQGCRDQADAMASRAKAAELMDQSHQLFSREDVTGRSWLRLWRGRLALERGLYDEAIMHLRSARSYHGRAPVARTFLGEAYLRSNEFELAWAEFDAALKESRAARKADPGNVPDPLDHGWGDSLSRANLRVRCYRGKAAALVEAGHTGKARRQIDTALRAVKLIESGEEEARAEALCRVVQAHALIAGADGDKDPATTLVKADESLARAIALDPTALAYYDRVRIRELNWQHTLNPIERRGLLDQVRQFKDQIDRLDGGGELAGKTADIAQRLNGGAVAVAVGSTNGGSHN
jgi:tetratricopeptide (TPR) repeat protein